MKTCIFFPIVFGKKLIFCLNISVEGQCYTFGSNQFGQLGNSTAPNRHPHLVAADMQHIKVSMVACGDTFTVVASEGMNVTMATYSLLSFWKVNALTLNNIK